MPQVKVGWRSGSVAAPSVSTMLLDVYSGAAVAYSLRKLKSSYTGSVIRVRRSSDNTELNIGFDSDGNLDTYALSAFVGTGNGFVTTWYDQSGNGRDATQTTAGNQPKIVINGVLNTLGTKAAINFDGSGDSLNSPYTQGSTNEMYLVTQTSDTYFVYPTNGLSTYGYVAQNGSTSPALYSNYGTPQLFTNGVLRTPVNRGDVYNILNGYKLVTHKNFSMSVWPSGYPTIIGVYSGSADYNGNVQEWLIYPTLQSSQSSIESNINSYYSVYPNPTSVWNLLAAAYNADSTASSSLKTSLFAAYNGESNANDSFGSNNGTAQGGLTYTAGKIGDAFQFNGTTSYVELPNTSNQFNFTDFSISAWFNTSLTTSGTIFSNYHYINNSNQYGYLLYLQGSRIRFAIYQGTTSPVVGFNGVNIGQSSLNITTNTWYHIVITKTASNDFKMYINGSLQSLVTISGSLNANPVYNSLNRVDIGSQWGGVWSLFNGKIDALNTWTKELTQSEITELYNSGNGAQYIGDNFYKPTPNDVLNTYNGTAVGGLTYGLGKVGTAFKFNGTNASVSLPDNSLNFTSKFSYSFWSKSNNTTDYGVVVGNVQSGRSPFGFFHGYEVSLESGKVYFYFRTGNNYQIYHYSTTVVNNGNWNHIVVTYDPTNITTGAKIYVNGTLDVQGATLGVSNPIGYTSPMKACIGARNHSGSTVNFLPSGTNIDALNIWQKELTQAEITELYNSGNGKQYPN